MQTHTRAHAHTRVRTHTHTHTGSLFLEPAILFVFLNIRKGIK